MYSHIVTDHAQKYFLIIVHKHVLLSGLEAFAVAENTKIRNVHNY